MTDQKKVINRRGIPSATDAHPLVRFVTTHERWRKQRPAHTAIRYFAAFAGEDPNNWTHATAATWGKSLEKTHSRSTMLHYLLAVENVIDELARVGAGQFLAPAGDVEAQKAAEETKAAEEPKAVKVIEIPLRCASWEEEDLLDELFVAFKSDSFVWSDAHEKADDQGLRAALEETKLDPDQPQWGLKFNRKLSEMQGKEFHSGLRLLCDDTWKPFRPIQWRIVKAEAPPKPPTPPVKAQKDPEAKGKLQWTTPPPGSLRAAAMEKPLKQLLMEGFMEGIVTGVVADSVMSGTDNAESTRKRLAGAYAKGFLDGKQLDWLAQRV